MKDQLLEEITPLINKLENHPLYQEINSLERLRHFMEQHVYAVFDFMSLVKNLQKELAPVNQHWTPPKDRDLARFINEIVLGEESDETPDGRFMSHYEMYCLAMAEVQANSDLPMAFARNFTLNHLNEFEIPKAAKEFMESTFTLIGNGKSHEIAAAFCFGREKCIPPMFQSLLDQMGIDQKTAPMFHFYLQRHIEVDGDSHGPLAIKMIEVLCGDDAMKWSEAKLAATKALKARISFWDHILEEIKTIGSPYPSKSYAPRPAHYQ